MWGRRFAAVATAATVATAGVVSVAAPASWAGWQGEPIVADVNGDGIADRNTLGLLPGSSDCRVMVNLGLAGGGFGPAQSYSYVSLPAGETNCPDMGVGLNLDGDAPRELAVTWFGGPPPTVPSTLLALDNFQVSGGFDTIFQPSYIGPADFNGDQLLDIYEWTDQGEGFATYLNNGTGMLAPGPVKYCSGRPQYELADFDRNGAMDVALAYLEGCGAFFAGVVVVLDNGTVIDLHGDVYGDSTWTVEVVDANNDQIPDALTHNEVTGANTTFIGSGNGTFLPAPRAVRDYPNVSGVKASGIPVLANDFATARTKVTIVTPPRYGTVQVTTSRTIIYRPAKSHARTDRFVYRLTEDGKTSNATVSLKVIG